MLLVACGGDGNEAATFSKIVINDWGFNAGYQW
jgi:hypothetical protein